MKKFYYWLIPLLLVWIALIWYYNRESSSQEITTDWLKRSYIPKDSKVLDAATKEAESKVSNIETPLGSMKISGQSMQDQMENPPPIDLSKHRPSLKLGWKQDFQKLIAEVRTIAQMPQSYPEGTLDKAIGILTEYQTLLMKQKDLGMYGLGSRLRYIVVGHEREDRDLMLRAAANVISYYDHSVIADEGK